MDGRESVELYERIRFRGRPVANPDSIVTLGNARFTVLTARLLRLEWSATGRFEDRSTYAFPSRVAPTPSFTADRDDTTLTVNTGALALRYVDTGTPFDADNLTITFDVGGLRRTWRSGQRDTLNLHGTRRTLDRCAGDAALDAGLLSRDGWVLYDDSPSVLFGEDGWVAPPREHQQQDWYFFGYGRDYKGALAEYTLFGGAIPLVPRFVLGAWWSRYWAYSAEELKELVSGFEQHHLPLDVLVLDMDWHTAHAWTGYTWNRELFPDPPAFLRWAHETGLRATLNLHPAQGVQPFEEVYPHFARAMGIDPASAKAVPFRISDRRFVRSYFKLLHHPREEEGVDFWWVDWQQGEVSEMKNLDPLPWLNHLHFSDSRRRGRRPILYSRWGGLGSHRYPIGFSGDTYTTWESLQFQPYFSATAANVAFGWWSHDIGGHMGGPTEPELFARWVQFGAMSPCLRLHATKDARIERRPWLYPEEVYRSAHAAFHLRYQLLPYLYTMARLATDTGLSLCRPMYYDHPESDAAYVARFQYYLGDQVIAAPIVHPADRATGLAATDVWVPEGAWIDYQTRETHTGPRWVRLIGNLDRLPMLVRAGAILPLAAPFKVTPPRLASGTTDDVPVDRLVLAAFPGGDGSFRLYEDDGLTEDYRTGHCEWTGLRNRVMGDTWEVSVSPVEGHCEILPRLRGYEIQLVGSQQPDTVTIDGSRTSQWRYDATTQTTCISVPPHDKSQPLSIVAFGAAGISALGEAWNRRAVLADVHQLLGQRTLPSRRLSDGPSLEDEDILLNAAVAEKAPAGLDAVARLGGPFVRFLEYTTYTEAREHLGTIIVGGPARRGEPFDLEVDAVRLCEEAQQAHSLRIDAATEDQILHLPFVFDGSAATSYWMAEVRITYRGRTLAYRHRSKPLFPAIYDWHVLVHDEGDGSLPLDAIVDAFGRPSPALNWRRHAQQPDAAMNLCEPHRIPLASQHRLALSEGRPLVGYLFTTLMNPAERAALLQFDAPGLVHLFLNGRPLDVQPAEGEPGIPAHFRMARTSVLTHLRAGENWLLVATWPAEEPGRPWSFSAAFRTPGGEPVTDIAFS